MTLIDTNADLSQALSRTKSCGKENSEDVYSFDSCTAPESFLEDTPVEEHVPGDYIYLLDDAVGQDLSLCEESDADDENFTYSSAGALAEFAEHASVVHLSLSNHAICREEDTGFDGASLPFVRKMLREGLPAITISSPLHFTSDSFQGLYATHRAYTTYFHPQLAPYISDEVMTSALKEYSKDIPSLSPYDGLARDRFKAEVYSFSSDNKARQRILRFFDSAFSDGGARSVTVVNNLCCVVDLSQCDEEYLYPATHLLSYVFPQVILLHKEENGALLEVTTIAHTQYLEEVYSTDVFHSALTACTEQLDTLTGAANFEEFLTQTNLTDTQKQALGFGPKPKPFSQLREEEILNEESTVPEQVKDYFATAAGTPVNNIQHCDDIEATMRQYDYQNFEKTGNGTLFTDGSGERFWHTAIKGELYPNRRKK